MMQTSTLSRRDFLRLAGPIATAGVLGCEVLAAAPAGGAKPIKPAPAPDEDAHGRVVPRLSLPFVDCVGTAFECGVQLGSIWKSALMLEAAQAKDSQPWWKARGYAPLLEKYCAHLPDVYRGMAKGAGVNENTMGNRSPGAGTPEGCTSFALAPEATLEGIPISGQTKDVPAARARELLVLRMKMSNAPSLLTLTYTGSEWLFGHGFVRGGTSIFRNSMSLEKGTGSLPYDLWGLIVQHCPSVEDVIEITNRYGVAGVFHVVVADERGGIVGIEGGKGGIGYLRPKRGIYVHANCVLSEGPLRATERDRGGFKRAYSLHRVKTLSERLEPEHGRLTAALAYNAMSDHGGYPDSICRHSSPGQNVISGAAVIVEPTRGLLHVTPGIPCQNLPRTYSIT